MRDLIIHRLMEIMDSDGLPRYFDCDKHEYIHSKEELDSLSDEDLLEVFETSVEFQG